MNLFSWFLLKSYDVDVEELDNVVLPFYIREKNKKVVLDTQKLILALARRDLIPFYLYLDVDTLPIYLYILISTVFIIFYPFLETLFLALFLIVLVYVSHNLTLFLVVQN